MFLENIVLFYTFYFSCKLSESFLSHLFFKLLLKKTKRHIVSLQVSAMIYYLLAQKLDGIDYLKKDKEMKVLLTVLNRKTANF